MQKNTKQNSEEIENKTIDAIARTLILIARDLSTKKVVRKIQKNINNENEG